MSTSNDYLMFITNDSAEAVTVHVCVCACLDLCAVHDKHSVVMYVCTHDLCTKSKIL